MATGRRAEKLQELASKYQNVSTVEWDLSELSQSALSSHLPCRPRCSKPYPVPATVDGIFKKHSGVNAVFLVSGLQRTTDFTKPKELNLAAIDSEILTNFTSCVASNASCLELAE